MKDVDLQVDTWMSEEGMVFILPSEANCWKKGEVLGVVHRGEKLCFDFSCRTEQR